MNQEQFIKKSREHRADKAEPMTGTLLAKMLEKNLPIYDVHYISNRAIKILEDVVREIKYEDKEIQKLRKEKIKSSIKKALGKLKDVKEEKDEQEETQKRNDRCEPVAREWVFALLDDTLLLSDSKFVDQGIEDDEMHLFYKIARSYLDEMHSQMITSLSINKDLADSKLWGVEKENITFSMLNDLVKKDLNK